MPKTTFVSGDRVITYARRDTFIAWLANKLLRLASKDYQATIGGAMRLGFRAAAEQAADRSAGEGSATIKPAQIAELHRLADAAILAYDDPELSVDNEDYYADAGLLAVAVMVDGSGAVHYMTSDGQWEDEDGEPLAWSLEYDEGSPCEIVWSEPERGEGEDGR